MTFSGELLLLLWVVASLLLNGIAFLRLLTKLRGLELLGYGAAAGVALHGLFGWTIAAAPTLRGVFVTILIALTFLSAAYFVWRRVFQELWSAFSKSVKIALALWLLLLVFCLGLLHVEIRSPHSLLNGIDIFNTPTTNV